jgi:hypothetical protein
MTVESSVEEWMVGCDPLPARECRCDIDIPWQDPSEAARCAKCGLRLSAGRASAIGALPELDFDASAEAPAAEEAEDAPPSAHRDPGPEAPDTQDGRPRRDGQAPQATAVELRPGSHQLLRGDAT